MFLQKLDIFGGQYQYNVGKNSTYKTKLGGFISIITIILVVTTTLIFTYNFFDTTSPEISTSTSIASKGPKRNLYDLKFPIGISLYKLPRTLISANDLFRYITPLMSVFELDSSGIGNGDVQFKAVEMIRFKPCSSLEDTTLSKDFLEGNEHEDLNVFFREYSFCPDVRKPEDFYVLANHMSPPYRTIHLNILPCMLPDKSLCAPPEELGRTYIGIVMIGTSFVPERKSNPLVRIPFVEEFKIGLDQETIYSLNFKGNKIFDDDSSVMAPKLNSEFTEKDEVTIYAATRAYKDTKCSMEMYAKRVCVPYLTLQLKSSGKTVIITRSYPKLLETLGEIGGTGELCVIIFGFFMSGITDFT